jgi:hypothetical protein
MHCLFMSRLIAGSLFKNCDVRIVCFALGSEDLLRGGIHLRLMAMRLLVSQLVRTSSTARSWKPLK